MTDLPDPYYKYLVLVIGVHLKIIEMDQCSSGRGRLFHAMIPLNIAFLLINFIAFYSALPVPSDTKQLNDCNGNSCGTLFQLYTPFFFATFSRDDGHKSFSNLGLILFYFVHYRKLCFYFCVPKLDSQELK
uniref:Uncharacterized protein n=1 Tax=Ditylenchus dipsaci TaxID=166011 RepID=A0A915CMI5_9BILA